MNTKKFAVGVSFLAVLLLVAACATTSDWGTTNPPIARVKIFDFDQSVDLFASTQIDFSVTNVTDQDLTGLTLTVTQNPSNGLRIPITEMTIDRIPAHGSWAPSTPLTVIGHEAGSSTIFLTVTKDGQFLAKDYAMIGVSTGDDDDRFMFER